MKQSDDPKKFFDKYKFTRTNTLPHPVFGDPMHFEGLEADYVNGLEHKVSQLEKHLGILMEKVDYLTSRDMYLLKKGLEYAEAKKMPDEEAE